MAKKRRLIGLALLAGVAAHAAEMPKEDMVKGVKDHPLLSRFAGSKLVAYDQVEFDERKLVAGKSDANGKPEKLVTVEGKFTGLAYNFARDRSDLEVMRNYQGAIQKAGMKVLFSCEKESCGTGFGDFMLDKKLQFNQAKFQGSSDYWSPFNHGRVAPRYLLAQGQLSDGRQATMAVYVVPPLDAQNGGVFLEIIEAKVMEAGKVAVNLNASEIAKGIAAEGKIALYGIYFDTGKSELKAESKSQLDEMAKLLRQDAALRVYIVGHTDNQGNFAANAALSQQRAEAVVKALAGQYKIDAKRLMAKGVANLAPLASNDDEVGRAKNRRVELVKQ